MSIWESYPIRYRSDEIKQILVAIKAGECVSVVGLSGAGKSNLMGFLAHRITQGPRFYFIDCNDLPAADANALLEALTVALGESQNNTPSLQSLIQIIDRKLNNDAKGICILLDRFDLFQLDTESGKAAANNLRALRDRFKYALTYVISTRRPLDPASELTELFYANTLWLGPLNDEDAHWSIQQFAARHGLDWNAMTIGSICSLSKGYP